MAKKRPAGKSKKSKPAEEQRPQAPPAEAIEPSRSPGCPVVGIGASAGGLEGFKKLFAAMPANCGMAFVLVPHLDPKQKSLMVELLGRQTKMPVVEASQGLSVEANHVYILPPNKYLSIVDGRLQLTKPAEQRMIQPSIDFFLRSLAEDQQEKAICIILSGTGGHGTLGLKAVKAAGGMAMVQDPKTAEYAQMPESAVASGLADYVLPPEQMPEMLCQYVQHFFAEGVQQAEGVPEQLAEQLTQVLAILRARSKFDFRCYRKKMLLRRVQRRLGLHHVADIPAYVKYLRDTPEEVRLLIKDLLISVTSFFRDPEAFQVLETQVIAPLVEHFEAEDTIRVWVPGCATGEEAYSIAMLLFEHLARAQKVPRFQIFATDVDEEALEAARQGVYPETIAADVSSERLNRFFVHLDEHSYQVNKQVREAVVFAPQNLIGDAPFSKLDLVSCRNLLIYLEPELQQRVLSLLHFALREGGYLFLGTSETIGRQVDLFEPLSKKWRVYRRIGASRPARVDFPLAGQQERRALAQRGHERPASFAELAQQVLLDEFAPTAVLINRKYEVLYSYGAINRYLELPAGEPKLDLMSMARESLGTKLRGAVHRAARDGIPVTVQDVKLRRSVGQPLVRVVVKPLKVPKAADGLLLVTFEDVQAEPRPAAPRTDDLGDETAVKQLEFELKATREDLQSTIEEMESSNEELKASNEEVMSMNEELQSANEEMETSKEELQSLNEELSTVNSQLQDKVEELERAYNDMENLLNCSDVATIFLDASCHIKRYNPSATRLFNLISSDMGRPIADIAQKFTDGELLANCRQVLQKLAPVEKEIQAEDGRWYIRHMAPYRTRDNRIEGVVVTFADITQVRQALEARSAAEQETRTANVELERRVAERTQELRASNVKLQNEVTDRERAEEAVRKSRERVIAILNTAAEGIITVNERGLIDSFNLAAERLFGYSAREVIGKDVRTLMPSSYHDEPDNLDRYLSSGVKEVLGQRKDGSSFRVELALSEVGDAHKPLFSGIIRNVEERKALEREVLEMAGEAQRQIGQDLHDGIGQELTGLSLMAQTLADSFADKSTEQSQIFTRLVAGLQSALRRIRSLSRGLVPVEVDSRGLMAALEDLATRTDELHGVKCSFSCPDAVSLDDTDTATQLYYIAQEAVTNALKHGKVTHIRVSLTSTDHRLRLTVQDDGTGIPEVLDGKGMGLKIMRHRASIINASLQIARADGKGTLITCTLSKG